MPRELKNGVNYKLILAVLSVMTFIFGTASILFDSILLPIAAAFFAALLLYENNKKRILSFLIPALTVLACAFISLLDTVFILPVLLAGILIALYFAKGRSKSECVFILVFIYSVSIFLLFVLIPIKSTGAYGLEAITEFYKEFYASTKEEFLLEFEVMLDEMVKSGNMPELYDVLTDEYVMTLFDTTVAHIPAIVVIVAFLYAGISMKIFSLIIKKLSKNSSYILNWIFDTTDIFAYFYIALSFLGVFFRDGSTIAIAMSNITLILMCVYAYLGVRAMIFIGKAMNRRGLLIFIMVFSILFLNVIAVEIYSFVGVFFTISKKRFQIDKK